MSEESKIKKIKIKIKSNSAADDNKKLHTQEKTVEQARESSPPASSQEPVAKNTDHRAAVTPTPSSSEQRPQSDRPYGRPQSDRPQSDRPQSDRPYGRPQSDRPYGRPQSDRPYGRPQGDGTYTPRPQGDRPYGQRPQGQGDRPYGQRPQGDRPYGQRPQGQGDRPYGQRPQGDRPYGQRPQGQGDRSYGQRPQGDRPYGQRPQGQGGRPGAPSPTTAASANAKTQSHRRDAQHKDKRVFDRNNKRLQEEIFLSKMQSAGKKKKGEAVVPEEIEIGPIIKISDLARKMNLKAAELISTLFKLGQKATINDDLDSDTAILLADEFGCRIIVKDEHEEVQIRVDVDEAQDLSPRPPIVTIMGHVDHGKTKLLDTIRKTNVVAHESGGITQHIGAYSVTIPQGTITFLDTPGHAAFTSMRARGAKITDIVILVVSAEEGPKPQTLEAISHAQAAKAPIIVAINKIDLPNADIERTKQMVAERGLLPEEWGGDTMFIPVSAATGQGIPELLESILLVSEVMDLKANPARAGMGFVVESKMDIGRGAVATVMIKNGTVRTGDSFISGTTHGRIRALFNDRGEKSEFAGPSIPVEIMGFASLPEAGDDFYIMPDEEEARSLAERRAILKRNEEIIRQKKLSMSNAMERIANPNLKEYKVLIKADVNGSLEAIIYALSALKNTEVKVSVIHSGIGAVGDGDVMLAQTLVDSSAEAAAILAFRVRVEGGAKTRAENADIPVRRFTVIYDLVEHVRSIIEGMLEPEVSETKIGEAEVRELIKITNIGKVAGSYVTEGFLRRSNVVRIFREGTQVWNGKFKSLRRFKDDVSEVQKGFECGITFENFDDFKVGDIVETYQVDTKERKFEISEDGASIEN
ncbi:MAG: translation initiation factor IF-2 [Brevinema sp.]